MGRRWRRNTLFIRVRNNIAFHIDPKVLANGLMKLCTKGERVLILGGDSRKRGHSSLQLGLEALLVGFSIKKTTRARLLRIMSSDQGTLTVHLQGVLLAALRLKVPGL